MKAYLALFLAMLSIQCGAAFAKSLFESLGPLTVAAGRLLFAAVLVLLWRRPWRFRLDEQRWRILIGYGASLGLMNCLFYLALARIPLGVAVALEFTGPLLLAFWKERGSAVGLAGFLALLGLFLLAPTGDMRTTVDPVGCALALAAGACWASYIVFGGIASHLVEGGVASSVGMGIAALLVLPSGIMNTDPSLLSWPSVALLAGVGFFSSALPYSLEIVALKNLRPSTFGLMMSAGPVTAALVAWPILGETLEMRQTVGILMICMALATQVLKR